MGKRNLDPPILGKENATMCGHKSMVEGLTIMLEEFLLPCYTHKQCQIATVLVLAFNDGYTNTTCGCSSSLAFA